MIEFILGLLVGAYLTIGAMIAFGGAFFGMMPKEKRFGVVVWLMLAWPPIVMAAAMSKD